VRHEAYASREAQRRQDEAEASTMLEGAKADARATLERASARIEEELRGAERQLDEMGKSLAAELAQRVLGRPLNGAN